MNLPNSMIVRFISILILLMLMQASALAQDTEITYQGQLRLTGEPFTGMADLEFRLFNQLTAGAEIGSAQLRPDWPVEDGLFQVELDFGAAAFEGSERFLEIRVDGAPLVPRQKITATPYALFATGVGSGSVGGGSIDPTEVQLRVSGSCAAGEYVRVINQNGSVVCGVDGGGNGSSGWSLNGNAGTDPATNFIGTTDATALELRTANVRSLRIEPSDILSGGVPITANVIAGSSANVLAAGVRGATIAGGGAPLGDSDPGSSLEGPNIIYDNYSVIGGGYGNTAGEPGESIDNPFIAIAGGRGNTASALASYIGGGAANIADGVVSSIGGGQLNLAEGDFSTVGGGSENMASGTVATIAGGNRNSATVFNSSVGGGVGNIASGGSSTIGGGQDNMAEGTQSTIAGGVQNIASGTASTVSGGQTNVASGFQSNIGGGVSNTASRSRSTVGGGQRNTASGLAATVPGGLFNCAGGAYSWAGGRSAKVRFGTDAGDVGSGCEGVPMSGDNNGDEGTFIWADSREEEFISDGPDQFLVRAQGGIGFGRTPEDYFEIQTPFDFEPGNGLGTQGVLRIRLNGNTQLRMFANGGLGIGSSFTSGGVPERGLRVSGITRLGTLGSAGTTQLCRNSGGEIASCSSSARYKNDIDSLDLGLDAILALQPVSYRWTSDGSADIGFVAEDVAELDERLITRNADGVVEGVRYERISAVLANAVQAMNSQQQHSQAEFQQLQNENTELRERLTQLENQQATELADMRKELAMMRELIAPRVAQAPE